MNFAIRRHCLHATALALLVAGCGGGAPSPKVTEPVSPVAIAFNQVSRVDFNRIAAELFLPLYWVEDADGTLDASELAILWGMGKSQLSDWMKDGEFSPQFSASYAKIVQRHKGRDELKTLGSKEAERRKQIRKELAQGRPTLLRSDFRKASAEDRAIVEHVLAAAEIIETLHAKQIGSYDLAKEIPSDDPASHTVLYRNQGPWCVAPGTEMAANCNAIPNLPKKVSGLYPASIQQDAAFCEGLKKLPNAAKLRHQFSVVVGEPGALKAVPYTEAYAPEMQAISKELKAAAQAIVSSDEKLFKAYLLAASQAFLDNNWEPADEAWAQMNVTNSKWYLRIGPDEVYFEPCNLKAGFHVSFARINQDSLRWQRKLDPVKGEMEKVLAKLAGPPYRARKVSFHLPDFIDIVLNAGDARSPLGATIGQSLPNWGPVANEGRGRTVAMTNLYTDADSQAALKTKVASVFCEQTNKLFSADPAPQVMGTVLHEAAHNLGPSHEYKVRGKTGRQIFEGPLASTMEELKAQTAALFFTDWLAQKKLISGEEAQAAHVRNVAWMFGHISRGMYDANGRAKSYSQLSAIQFGFLLKQKAAVYKAEMMAANGSDKGCLELDLSRFPAVVEELMRDVARIKGRGDSAGALALKKEFVDDKGEVAKLRSVIRERWLRSAKASFVYSISY